MKRHHTLSRDYAAQNAAMANGLAEGDGGGHYVCARHDGDGEHPEVAGAYSCSCADAGFAVFHTHLELVPP